MMKYLKNIKTLEELKREYYKWAMKLHPDRGGDLEEMKVLNNEYDALFARVSHLHTSAKGETYEKKTEEAPSWFKDIVDALFKIPGIRIIIVGSFVWVEGVSGSQEDKPKRDALKALGFVYAAPRKKWKLPPPGYHYSGRKYDWNEVCDMFGVKYTATTPEDDEKPKKKKGGKKTARKALTA